MDLVLLIWPKCRQGEGGKGPKSRKFCGRPLWMIAQPFFARGFNIKLDAWVCLSTKLWGINSFRNKTSFIFNLKLTPIWWCFNMFLNHQKHFSAPLPTNSEQHICGEKQHDCVPSPRGYHLEYDGETPCEDEQQLRRREGKAPDSCALIYPNNNLKVTKRERKWSSWIWGFLVFNPFGWAWLSHNIDTRSL